MAKPQVVAGETVTGVWCVPCNAPVAVRVPLHLGDLTQAAAAEITVCASCVNRFIPSTPQVTVSRLARRRPRLWLAFTLWRYRHQCGRLSLAVRGCAIEECPRPGWHECACYEAVELGRIR
jgi:hypothetical protein